MRSLRLPSRALAAIVLSVASTACIAPAPACEDMAAEIGVVVTASAMDPNDPAACRGDEVTMRIASEVDGFVHVHGFDEEELPAIAIAAGETSEVTFEAVRSGQFPIELHLSEDPAGISIGVLSIHEP